MHRIEAHGTRTTGILSVVLLCLTVAFSLLCFPVADSTSFASWSKSATNRLDVPDQHTAPAIPRSQLVAVVWRVVEAAAPQDDGKSKMALPPAGASIPEHAHQLPGDAHVVRSERRWKTDGFDARAPPTLS
jgi:hypothetical protein